MNSNAENPDSERRRFLGQAAAAGVTATLAPGLVLVGLANAKAPEAEVTNATRWGMLVDTGKCTNCGDCVTACDEEHGLTPAAGQENTSTDAEWIRMVELKNKNTGKVTSLPLMCQHCENPPCVDVCPTGASFKRADNIVLVDKHTCIGCRYCMMACPYKARSFIHEKIENQVPDTPRGMGTVESCNLCVNRVDDGQQPACVEACQEQVIVFGNLKDPESAIAKKLKTSESRAIREDLGLNPGVRYQGI